MAMNDCVKGLTGPCQDAKYTLTGKSVSAVLYPEKEMPYQKKMTWTPTSKPGTIGWPLSAC